MMTPKNDRTRLQEHIATTKPTILPMIDNNQKYRLLQDQSEEHW